MTFRRNPYAYSLAPGKLNDIGLFWRVRRPASNRDVPRMSCLNTFPLARKDKVSVRFRRIRGLPGRAVPFPVPGVRPPIRMGCASRILISLMLVAPSAIATAIETSAKLGAAPCSVAVVANLPVCLFVHIRGGDEHPELPVFDPTDQTRELFDADGVTGCKSLQTGTKFFWCLF